MNKIPMIILALALPLAHAMPVTQAKVIHVKQWTTNNANVNFRLVSSKNADESDSHTRYIGIRATTKPQSGVVGTPNTYISDSEFFFYNTTNETQTVEFHFYTCIDDVETNQVERNFPSQCGYYNETVRVQPKGMYRKQFNPEITVNFSKPGEYSLITSSRGFFANADYMGREIYASSSAKITVTG